MILTTKGTKDSTKDTKSRARCETVWCAIPVYNNAATVRGVVERTLACWPQVMVVDDGSTDADVTALLADLDCTVLRHAVNQGKGAAIQTAARAAAERGARWLVTLDADGQHDPDDLPAFLRVLEDAGDDDTFVVIGARDMSAPHIPKGSRFGRAFSDAWVRLETGVNARDTQSGFRAYPVRHLNRLRLSARRYDFEIEVLVRLLWGGLDAVSVPVGVWYPQPDERRISHFRPFLDNARLSWLHTRLMMRRLLPWPHRRIFSRNDAEAQREEKSSLSPRIGNAASLRLCEKKKLLSPLAFFREIALGHASPFELAAASAVGIFFGTLPLVATHSVVIAYVAVRLRLNLLVALSIQSLCMPPVVPVACVLLGYRLRVGAWMSDLAWAKIPSEYLARLLDWLLGSLVLAPVLSVSVALAVYAVAAWRRSARGAAFDSKRQRSTAPDCSRQQSPAIESNRVSVAGQTPRAPKRGNAFGLAWFRLLVRVGGLRVAYAMLYPVCLHYALFDRAAVRSALPYIRHRFAGLSHFRQWLAAYRIFLEQGRMLVDRHAALARPALVDISLDDGIEAQLRSLASGGGVLLMSHAGNWQAAIPTLALLGKPVHLVMAVETNAAVAQTLKIGDGCGAVRVIDAGQFMGAAPQIVNALGAGEIVSFMGDRAYGAADAPVTFLGGTARFPIAAFRIAAATGKPVCFLFVPRVGRGRYRVQVPATVTPAGRGDIPGCLARYAAALESFATDYPYQCFPFADLWHDSAIFPPPY